MQKKLLVMVLLLSSFSMAISAIFISKTSFDSVSIIFWRSLFGIPVLLPFIFFKNNNYENTTGNKGDWKNILSRLLIYRLLSTLAYLFSFQFTSVSHILAIYSLGPIFVLGKKFKDTKQLKYYELVGISIASVGCLMLIFGNKSSSNSGLFGDLLILVSLIFYVYQLDLIKQLNEVKKVKVSLLLFYSNIMLILLFFPFILSGLSFKADELALIFLSSVTILLGYGIVYYLAEKVENYKLQLTNIFTPICGLIVGLLIGAEKFSVALVVLFLIIALGLMVSEGMFLRISKINKIKNLRLRADDGDRTRIACLEGRSSSH